jgi:hypothetical protein
VNQQRFVTQVAALRKLETADKVFMVASDAHPQNPALHADRPHPPVPVNKGVLHFWPFASRVARRNFASALSQNRT